MFFRTLTVGTKAFSVRRILGRGCLRNTRLKKQADIIKATKLLFARSALFDGAENKYSR